MSRIRNLNTSTIGHTLIELVCLVIDLVLAHGTFEVVLDDSQLAYAVAVLVAVVIYMAGHVAGQALFRGERAVAAVALGAGVLAIGGVGVVRALFGLGGGAGATSGVAEALGTSSANDSSDLVMAVIVTILMLGVLAIGSKVSSESAETRASRLAAQIAVMGQRAFDLGQERSFLARDLEAARGTLRATVEDIAAQVVAASLPQAADDEAADAMVDTIPVGRILTMPVAAPASSASSEPGSEHVPAAGDNHDASALSASVHPAPEMPFHLVGRPSAPQTAQQTA